jgi:hypothetical protein
MRRKTTILTLSALAIPLAVTPAPAQSAGALLDRAFQAYEQRMSGVENYTVTQRVMGIESTMRFEREMVDGRPTYRVASASAAGQTIPADGEGNLDDAYASFRMLRDRARLDGRETIDGASTHVLRVDDFSGVAGFAPSPAEGEFTVESGRLFVDDEQHLLRGMTLEGVAVVDGQRHPVTMEMRMHDFREVGGMLHPFRTVIRTSGLAPTASAEEMAQARASMEELQQQMRSMPAAQREMMERMVRPQIEQFERMLEGEAVEVQIEVVDVRVNEAA